MDIGRLLKILVRWLAISLAYIYITARKSISRKSHFPKSQLPDRHFYEIKVNINKILNI